MEARTTPLGGWRYLVPTLVGSPSVLVPLLLDTGSHMMIVRDEAVGACVDPPVFGGICFNYSASTSVQKMINERADPFKYLCDVDVELTVFPAHATVVRDVVSIAGLAPSPPPYATNQSTAAPGVIVQMSLMLGGFSITPKEHLPYFWADAGGAPPPVGGPADSTRRSPPAPLRVRTGAPPHAGVIGASRSSDGSNAWEVLLASHNLSTFALDLNRGESPSRLLLGGDYSPSANGTLDVRWSERAASASAVSYQQLHLVDPSVCGAALLAAVSGFWPAIVDSGSSCLSVRRPPPPTPPLLLLPPPPPLFPFPPQTSTPVDHALPSALPPATAAARRHVRRPISLARARRGVRRHRRRRAPAAWAVPLPSVPPRPGRGRDRAPATHFLARRALTAA